MKNSVSSTPESLPENYSVLSLTYTDHKPLKQALGKQTQFALGDMSGQPSPGRIPERLPKAMINTEVKPLEIRDTAEQPPEPKTLLVEQERDTSLPDLDDPEFIEEMENWIAEQRKKLNEVKPAKGIFCPPDSSFDYEIRFIARKSYLPHQLVDKAVPDKPDFLERWLIKKLDEKINDYGCLITHFTYGWRLGNSDKPHAILVSLSDKYIEEVCKQVFLLAGPETPFDAQDLKEARETIASLMCQCKTDGYFSPEGLAKIAHVAQHIVNWAVLTFSESAALSTSSNAFFSLRHLRYPPKSPPKLSFKEEALYSPYKFDWDQLLAQFSFYIPYITLFEDIIEAGIIKHCPVCDTLFSRPKSKKKYFDRQVYCSEQCRKKAERHRHYEKHKEKLKPMRRQEMKGRRKYYKDRGNDYDKKVRGTL